MSYSQSIPSVYCTHNPSRLCAVVAIHMNCDYDIQMGWIITTPQTEGMDWDYDIQMGWIVTTYIWDGLWLQYTDGMECDYDIQTGWIVTTTYRCDGMWLWHTDHLYVVTIHPVCMSYLQSIPSVCRTYNPSRLYVVVKIHPVCMS
jgi:hypothetical protein